MEPDGIVRRRRLPHWDVPGAVYFVTTCLAASIPAQGLLDIEKFRMKVDKRPRPAHLDPQEWKIQKAKMIFARTDEWLDQRPAVRFLEDPQLAAIVVEAVNHFAGVR